MAEGAKSALALDLQDLMNKASQLPGVADILAIEEKCEGAITYTNEYFSLITMQVSESTTDCVSG